MGVAIKIPKGKRKGQRFSKNGCTYVVATRKTAKGGVKRYARKVNPSTRTGYQGGGKLSVNPKRRTRKAAVKTLRRKPTRKKAAVRKKTTTRKRRNPGAGYRGNPGSGYRGNPGSGYRGNPPLTADEKRALNAAVRNSHLSVRTRQRIRRILEKHRR